MSVTHTLPLSLPTPFAHLEQRFGFGDAAATWWRTFGKLADADLSVYHRALCNSATVLQWRLLQRQAPNPRRRKYVRSGLVLHPGVVQIVRSIASWAVKDTVTTTAMSATTTTTASLMTTMSTTTKTIKLKSAIWHAARCRTVPHCAACFCAEPLACVALRRRRPAEGPGGAPCPSTVLSSVGRFRCLHAALVLHCCLPFFWYESPWSHARCNDPADSFAEIRCH